MPKFWLQKEGSEDWHEVDAPDVDSAASKLASGVITKSNEALPAFPEEPLTGWDKFGHGMIDPLYGVQQLYAHTAQSPEKAQAADKMVAAREANLKARGMRDFEWARVGGRMVPGAAVGGLASGVGLGSGIIASAVGGAGTEMLNPVTEINNEDFWEQKGKQGVVGGVAGGVAGGVIRGGANLIGGALRPDARALVDAGVQLTPGRMAGGILSRAEDAFKSWPIIGHFIRGAEGRTLQTYNTSTINQALEPIGRTLPAGTPAGHDAITYATQALDHAYDSILRSNPNWVLTPNLAPRLFRDIAGTAQIAQSSLPPQGVGQQFATILRDRVLRTLDPLRQGQPLPVAVVDSLDAELRHFVTTYRGAGDPAQREMARFLADIRGSLRDTLTLSNPQAAQALRNTDYAYAMLTRVQEAAAQRRGSMGVFTPMDMLAAVRKQDPTVRKNAYAQGNALMQQFAETAQRVIPSGLADSGTPERIMWHSLPALAAGGAKGASMMGVPGPALAGLAGGAAAYSAPGMSLVNMTVRNPSPFRQVIGNVIRNNAPIAAGAMEPSLQDMVWE